MLAPLCISNGAYTRLMLSANGANVVVVVAVFTVVDDKDVITVVV